MRPFAELLKEAVKTAGHKDLKAFALAKGFTQPQMSRLTTGNRLPTVDMLGKLADALSLKGAAKAGFIESAHLARATPEVRALVARLRADLAEMRKDRMEIMSERAELVALLRAQGHKLPKLRGDV